MRAVIFNYSLPRLAYARVLGTLTPRAYLMVGSPTGFRHVPEPELLGDDWTIVRTQVCGICGSDMKQIFLDASFDNPLTSFVSFPQILGHEAVGIVERVGPAVKTRRAGERVLLTPWLGCTPRGITPKCDACRRGQYYLCEHHTEGKFPPGIHSGTCRTVTGGYAEFFPAHESQLFPIPDEVSFEQAVLADPFSVGLHSILKAPPREGGWAIVYGCGSIGLLTLAALRSLFPGTRVIAIARYPHQVQWAQELGAECVISTRDTREILERIAQVAGLKLYHPWNGKPWSMGGVDVIYDTIGSAESLEVGVRIVRPGATIVVTGVDSPARFEWTPLYFKEIAILGSNAFGVEDWEGVHAHAMEMYLNLVAQKRIDMARLVTHHFRLEQYRDALLVTRAKGKHRAVKVVFDYRI